MSKRGYKLALGIRRKQQPRHPIYKDIVSPRQNSPRNFVENSTKVVGAIVSIFGIAISLYSLKISQEAFNASEKARLWQIDVDRRNQSASIRDSQIAERKYKQEQINRSCQDSMNAIISISVSRKDYGGLFSKLQDLKVRCGGDNSTIDLVSKSIITNLPNRNYTINKSKVHPELLEHKYNIDNKFTGLIVGNLSVKSELRNLKINPERLTKLKKGDVLKVDRLSEQVDEIAFMAGSAGYAFPDVSYNIKSEIDNPNIIDIEFHIKEGPRVYVDRIDIIGNTRTLDYIVKRESEHQSPTN